MVRNFDTSPAARERSFEDLVIPEDFRELLVALVNNHASGQRAKSKKHGSATSAQIDVVRGKGRGLIVLLHGPPGTGKTGTAETIAAYTQRPLYTITCGDIGLDPTTADMQLEHHFELANKWGAVLLLDEADVFLVTRDWTNMSRNALVSSMFPAITPSRLLLSRSLMLTTIVFLRHLEYYSGILFF
jgi:hypothetical protein